MRVVTKQRRVVVSPSQRPQQTTPNSAVFVITTDAVDRDRDEVDPEGIDFSEWQAAGAPVYLGHEVDSRLPIGSSINPKTGQLDLWRAGKGWKARCHFDMADPVARQVARKIHQGYGLRAASVAFVPKQAEPNGHGGHYFRSVALTEWSIVGVPSNPQAVMTGKQLDALCSGASRVVAKAIRRCLGRGCSKQAVANQADVEANDSQVIYSGAGDHDGEDHDKGCSCQKQPHADDIADEAGDFMRSDKAYAKAYRHAADEAAWVEKMEQAMEPAAHRKLAAYAKQFVEPRMQALRDLLSDDHPDADMEELVKALGQTSGSQGGYAVGDVEEDRQKDDSLETGEDNLVDAGAQVDIGQDDDDDEAEPYAGQQSPEQQEMEEVEKEGLNGDLCPECDGAGCQACNWTGLVGDSAEPAAVEINDRYRTPPQKGKGKGRSKSLGDRPLPAQLCQQFQQLLRRLGNVTGMDVEGIIGQ
jgi:hypothetical protein